MSLLSALCSLVFFRAQVTALTDVSCAICPRIGGIFKRTVKGDWTHLFCALITPGVTFADPDHLDGVNLKGVNIKVQCSRSGEQARHGTPHLR